jgi:hypothetical protein
MEALNGRRTMQHSPSDCSNIRSLARLLAGWMAVIVLLQGLAAACAIVIGPQHRHAAAAKGVAIEHVHDGAQRHHHRIDDMSVLHEGAPLDTGELAAAGTVLLCAFSAVLTSALVWSGSAPRHVGSATALWAPTSRHVAPPKRPPRQPA